MKLQGKYGQVRDIPWQTKLSFTLEESLKTILLIIIVIVSLPFMLIGISTLFFTKKKIININGLINRLLGKSQNVRV